MTNLINMSVRNGALIVSKSKNLGNNSGSNSLGQSSNNSVDTPVRNEPTIVRSSPRLIISQHEYLYYFSDLTNKKKILEGIDLIWRTGNLFSEPQDPNSKFYTQYNEFLKDVIKVNQSDFSKYVKKLHVKSINFSNEFFNLSKHKTLNELQKSICLTQALELALLGIDSTPVLANINSSHIVYTTASDGTTTMADHTKGYRNELFAAWFLAKFILPSPLDKFILSEKYTTHKRSYDDKGNPLFGSRYQREIDMLGKDFITSVKSSENHFPQQIASLFFIVVDDMNLDLKNTIKKILLIRSAEYERQYSPEFINDIEYKRLKNKAIVESKDIIEDYPYPINCDISKYHECLQRLVSKEGLEIYFLPAVNDFLGLKSFIKQNYERLDNESKKEEKIA